MQPFVIYNDGVVRFKMNSVVDRLLEESQARGFGLNELACCDGLSQEDWEQFYQLIGYSLCGYHELSRVSDESAMEATKEAKKQGFDVEGCRDSGCSIHCGVERE